MSRHAHTCAEGNDPRAKGRCVKCGKTIPSIPGFQVEVHTVEHDLCDEPFETEATIIAARQAGADGRALNDFAIARKLPGPVTDHITRDFLQDTAEELADARNYLVWWMEQERAKGTLTTERQWHLMQALGAVATAWHHAVSV